MVFKKALPPAELLWELFEYNVLTGTLHWRHARRGVGKGKVAGCIGDLGYRSVGIKGITYSMNRIVYIFHNGDIDISELDIDHIDKNRDNNRIDNLQALSREDHLKKDYTYKPSGTGIKGIHKKILPSGTIMYKACLKENGKEKYYGCYLTIEEAQEALTRKENLSKNKPKKGWSNTGIKGIRKVVLHSGRVRYRAYVSGDYVGTFDSIEGAKEAISTYNPII